MITFPKKLNFCKENIFLPNYQAPDKSIVSAGVMFTPRPTLDTVKIKGGGREGRIILVHQRLKEGKKALGKRRASL